jgi:hypothetical protein
MSQDNQQLDVKVLAFLEDAVASATAALSSYKNGCRSIYDSGMRMTGTAAYCPTCERCVWSSES